MSTIGNTIQSADWKKEKHAPIIHVPEGIKVGEAFKVSVSIGDEIAHPNTLEHHIAWISLYFLAEGAKFPVQVAHAEFKAHGEGDIFTEPLAKVKLSLAKSGKFIAVSYCNIHGLWENELDVVVK
ncbi:MAG: class II SORL domain-containing protein [Anaerolineae bacterium]|jgi:superoxide reductase|nr:class II SORL domain-containing protein [Anaerolineae bacterium]